jgi:hypothetical protein
LNIGFYNSRAVDLCGANSGYRRDTAIATPHYLSNAAGGVCRFYFAEM